MAGEQHFRGIFDLNETVVFHLKDADLIRRAEAVLRRAEDAVGHVLVALEIEHAVHHVLEHLGTGNGALLVDVADHKHRDALPLGELHERHRAVLDLTDAACGRIQLLVVERLDGVHDQNVRRFLADTFEHIAETGLREHIKVPARDLEPLGAHLELVRRFLAGYIQDLGKAAELTANL